MTNMPQAQINRIIKNTGAQRISKNASILLTQAVEQYTEKLGECCLALSQHAGRKTITEDDVRLAIQYQMIK